jgi:ribosomal protein S18 acetylase RimI-like enzyme
VARVHNLVLTTVRPRQPPPGLTEVQLRSWDRLVKVLDANEAMLRLAAVGGETVGHALTFVRISPLVAEMILGWQGERPDLPQRLVQTRSALVTDVLVRDGYRRLGIGHDLVVDSGAVARQAGCARLVLHVNPENRGARLLYERLGFRREVQPQDDVALEYTWELKAPVAR